MTTSLDHSQLWLEAIEALPAAAFIHDSQFRVLHCNTAYAAVAGVPRGQLIGQPYYQLFPRMDGALPACAEATAGGRHDSDESAHAHPDGRLFRHRCSPFVDYHGERLGLHVLEDVTAQRRVESELHRTREMLERMFDTLHMAVALLDADFNFLRVNPAYAAADRRRPEDFPGRNHFDLYPDADNEAVFRRILTDGTPYYVHAKPFAYPDHPERGVSYWDWSLLPVKEQDGRVGALLLQLQDVTERTRAQLRLRRLNRLYALLSECGQTVVRADSEEELLQEYCRNLVLVGGYRFAWIGQAEQNAAHSVYPLAWDGVEEGYFADVDIRCNDSERGHDPVCTAVRSGVPYVARRLADDPRFAPWRKAAQQRGYQSMIVLPLRSEDVVTGALAIYAAESDAFDDEEVELLAGLADDLSYARAALRSRASEQEYRQQLEYQATHDALTGLPNRVLLHDRLQHGIAQAVRQGSELAVLVVDLDNLKMINDSLGHRTGDALLREAAGRLRDCARAADTVAHLSGDEFVLLMTDVEDINHPALLAERALGALSRPVAHQDAELHLTASIGIAIYPRDGTTTEALLCNAGAALHRAKAVTRNSFNFYTPEMNSEAHDRLRLEALLRRALEGDELQLHFQPQVELASGRIVGAEALLRWQQPELGDIPPARFIPLAEDTGLILPLGQWVLRAACRQAVAWQRAGLPSITIAVNVSAHQLASPTLIQDVRTVLAQSGLEPSRLALELTESAVMTDPHAMQNRLLELKRLGVYLALDDFGTGYSCLSHLQHFPFDHLKVDRSFVEEVTSNPHSTALVRTIVAIARSLKMHIIAEGAEQEGQVQLLRRLHCDQIQGFFFSRPLPAEAFARLLREQPTFALAAQDADAAPTILVVDDEVNVTNALRRELGREGYHVLTTNEPKQAFELLAQHKVQVLLVDHRMPRMSGTELLDRARQIHPEVVRMMLSGYTDLAAVTDAVNRGNVYKFLTKPWDTAELRSTLREAVAHHRASQQQAENEI